MKISQDILLSTLHKKQMVHDKLWLILTNVNNIDQQYLQEFLIQILHTEKTKSVNFLNKLNYYKIVLPTTWVQILRFSEKIKKKKARWKL